MQFVCHLGYGVHQFRLGWGSVISSVALGNKGKIIRWNRMRPGDVRGGDPLQDAADQAQENAEITKSILNL